MMTEQPEIYGWNFSNNCPTHLSTFHNVIAETKLSTMNGSKKIYK